MALLPVQQFGGIIPKTYDPRLIPETKGQTAKNCRFDHGGVLPLNTDTTVTTPSKSGPLLSAFLYQNSTWFSWNTDVDACLTPVANDSHKRVYYTENGTLKATDNVMAVTGGTDYPHGFYLPSPPAPSAKLYATEPASFYNRNASYLAGAVVYQGRSPNRPSPVFYQSDGDVPNYAIPAYDASAKYAAKQVVQEGADYYSCNADIATPEAFTAAHWTKLTPPGEMNIDYFLSPYILDYHVSTGAFRLMDPTSYVSVGYVYTMVNSYGDEGPPSEASNLVPFLLSGVFPTGDPYQITLSIDTTDLGQPDQSYHIERFRFYRLNQDASGNEQYQFALDVMIYDATKIYKNGDWVYRPYQGFYVKLLDMTAPEAWDANHWSSHAITDGKLGAELGEVLATLLWDPAPAGLKGLIPLPDAGLAGYVGNQVCFSVPGFPHAWPLNYRRTSERDIMGLGSYGLTTIVLTQGIPYLVTSNGDPSSASMEEFKEGFGCLSKRSVVDLAGTLVYASTEGITAIYPGKSEVLTRELMSPEDWRTRYNPASITGFAWSGKYLGFYDNGHGGAGFIFDPATGNLVDLDFYATGGYRDPVSGLTYLIIGGNIVSFCTGNTRRSMDHKGRLHTFHPTHFSAIKVFALSYPVSVDIVYPPGQLVPGGDTVSVSVTSSAPQRIRPVVSDSCEVRVYGGVSALFLAGSLGELPQ